MKTPDEALRTAISLARIHGAPCYAPYQEAGIKFLCEDGRDWRIGKMLGHDPGLGKTAQAIGAAAGMELQRVVICCPAAVCKQWQNECKRWAGVPAWIVPSTTAHLPSHGWIICAYTRTNVLRDLFRIDALILDEFHFLKNVNVARTKMIWGNQTRQGLRHIAARIWLLSGTPIPNRVIEIAHFCRVCRPVEFPSYKWFLDRYCGGMASSYYGGTNLGELKDLLKSSGFLHRVRQEDVEMDLPEVRRDSLELDIGESQLKSLVAKIAEMIPVERQWEVLDALENSKAMPDMDAFARVRALIGEAKAAAGIDYILTEAESGPLLVYTYHVGVAVAVTEAVRKAGFSVFQITGKVSPGERAWAVKAFQNEGRGVMVATIGSMGTGVDGLQNCTSRVIFLEASYVPGSNHQAEHRLARIGQEKKMVHITYLYAPVALDEHLVRVTAMKARTIEAVLG